MKQHRGVAVVFSFLLCVLGWQDLVWEFVSAIVEQRQAVPSFYEGLMAQIIADTVLESYDKRRWLEIPATQ